jgi:enoyl-CoA hydratase
MIGAACDRRDEGPDGHSKMRCVPRGAGQWAEPTERPDMVHTETRGSVTWLRMESGKVQAIDDNLVGDLSAAIERAAAAGSPPLVLTGTGTSFSAGIDLFRLVGEPQEYTKRSLPAFAALLRALFTYPGPLVAAVNGHAIAGGAILAWCGDLCVMASGKGRIGVPELKVGLPFPAAAVEVLRFALGGRRLQSLVYLGATLSPDEALTAGLVDEVVPPELLGEHAVSLAARLGAMPAESFRLTKQALRRPFVEALERHGQAADEQVLAAWLAPGALEAVRAYLNRTFNRGTP